jgi:Na+-driven multidrug efflux pump
MWLAAPLVLAQLLQRLFHLVDNRFVGAIGGDALLIHNIQYTIFVMGQFLATAGATSCLILWTRTEFASKKRPLLLKHLALSGGAASLLAGLAALNIPALVNHFAVSEAFRPLAIFYISIGLANMVLTAVYGVIDGILVASGRFRTSLAFAASLLAGNILLDAVGIYGINPSLSGDVHSFEHSLRFIGISTSLLLVVMIFAALRSIRDEIRIGTNASFADIAPIWFPELGTALIRSISPLVFAYQVGLIAANSGFIVTYNFRLHLAYLCCLPLSASIPMAVRRASRLNSGDAMPDDHRWQIDLFAGGLIPTSILLLTMAMCAAPLMQLVFGYSVPASHISFLPLYFLAVTVGQLGNFMTVPLRAQKLSHLVTRNFFIAEICVQLGTCQLLIWSGHARPDSLWSATLAFTTSYLFMTMMSLRTHHSIKT